MKENKNLCRYTLPPSPPFCSPLFAENLFVIEAEKERNIDDVNLQK